MVLESLNSAWDFQHKWWASNLRHVQNADISPVDCYFLIILTSPLATPDFSQEIMRCDAGDCDLGAHDLAMRIFHPQSLQIFLRGSFSHFGRKMCHPLFTTGQGFIGLPPLENILRPKRHQRLELHRKTSLPVWSFCIKPALTLPRPAQDQLPRHKLVNQLLLRKLPCLLHSHCSPRFRG